MAQDPEAQMPPLPAAVAPWELTGSPIHLRRRGKPTIIYDEVYEITGVVTVRIRCGSPKQARIWRERLRSYLLKIAVLVEKRLAASVKAEWGEPVFVGREVRERET